MAHKTKKLIRIEDVVVPLIIHREWRNNVRIALGTKAVNLRLPSYNYTSLVKDPIQWAEDWILKKYKQSPHLFDRFRIKKYFDGQIIQTTKKAYTLKIYRAHRKSMKANIAPDDNQITLIYPKNWEDIDLGSAAESLISSCIAADQFFWVSLRLMDLKDAHFPEVEINRIRLKNNKSNWGSCSSQGNINLSTRLLKAPLDVIDYVIIHELTHLIHPNHSRLFWKKVEEIMPDYKQKERWLSKNSHLCVF